MLELRLFGTGRARYNECPLAGFPNQLPYLLLCFLVLNRQRAHSREQLASVFWGDSGTSLSLKHLRNTLWRMRHLLESAGASLEEYLLIGEGAVSFQPTSPYWLDVEAFEEAAIGCQRLPARSMSPEQAASLEEAVEFYGGELLEGIYLDWCLYDRERLHLLYLNSLSRLMAFHAAGGHHERALEYGRRILVCDNTRESTHRQMMHLYWLAGDRNAALLQYKSCAQTLIETLGVVPMEETQRLYRQILRDDFPHTPSFRQIAPGPTRQHVEGTPSLLDRTAQALRSLQARLDEANAELSRLSHLVAVMQERQDAGDGVERRTKDAG